MSSLKVKKVLQPKKFITMVLLGLNNNKSMIGNTILQDNWFRAGNERHSKMKQEDDRFINIINTPENLLWPIPKPKAMSEKELNTSYPDPHVFLLVLQEKISEDEIKIFKHMKRHFGEKLGENTIVVLISEEEECSIEPYERAEEDLKKILDDCGKRVCVYKKNKDLKEPKLKKKLMEMFDEMHPSNTPFADHLYETVDDIELMKMKQKDESKEVQQSHRPITMVLLGTNSSNKFLIVNAISQTKCFELGPGMINAKFTPKIKIIINQDHFFEQESAGKEEQSSSYQDSHLFLLVLQNNTISQDEIKMFDSLKGRFGKKMVESTIIVMVTKEEGSREPYERADEELKKVMDECGKRVCVYKKNEDVKESELMKELMEKWDQIQKNFYKPTNAAAPEELYVKVYERAYKGEKAHPSADDYITVVLVGKNNADKCLIGNAILEEKPFKSEDFEISLGKVEDQNIFIIKTPNVLRPDPEEDSLVEMKPSFMGPRVFLLILHENDVSPDEEQMFTQLKKTYGKDIGKNTILFVNSPKHLQETSSLIQTKILTNECKNKVCQYNKDITKHELLKELMKYREVLKNPALKSARESNSNSDISSKRHMEEPNIQGEKQAAVLDPHKHQTSDPPVLPIPAHTMSPASAHPMLPTSAQPMVPASVRLGNQLTHSTPMSQSIMTIVLLGQTGSGKSASGNTILGQPCFESYANSLPVTQKCQNIEGTVSGMKIRVIDTPDFFNEDLKNQEEELRRCKDLIQHGPVVYLLVMELGRFTDGEREVLPRLKKEFGEDMTAKTVILFTNQEKLKNKSLKDYIDETDKELQKIIQTCQSRCCAFNNNKKSAQQVKELMDIILNIIDGNMPTGKSPHYKIKTSKLKDGKKCRIM